MDDLGALERACAQYQWWLDAVSDDQWSAATRCGDWNVSDLTAHVSGGNQMSVALLDGADAATARAAISAPAGEDPRGWFAATSAAQLAAFNVAGALSVTVHHPAMDMPGESLLMFRTLDVALHGWDLATSLGLDPTLDTDLTESLWQRVEPIAPLLGASGLFGSPEGEAPEGATSQQKLLHATGR